MNVLLLNLAFFIFLVSRLCFDLSISARNSFNLIPSDTGRRPNMNFCMRRSQYAVSSVVHRPVRSSDEEVAIVLMAAAEEEGVRVGVVGAVVVVVVVFDDIRSC